MAPVFPTSAPRVPVAARPEVGRTTLRRAFTLLELLVVLGLIAILAALVIGVGRRAGESGRDARARAELTALAAALESYRLAQGDFPRTAQLALMLQALIGRRRPDGQAMAGRNLLELGRFTTAGNLDPLVSTSAVLTDPWERPYRYAYKPSAGWTNPSYVLWSTGPDGEEVPLSVGGYPDATAAANADNLYANR